MIDKAEAPDRQTHSCLWEPDIISSFYRGANSGHSALLSADEAIKNHQALSFSAKWVTGTRRPPWRVINLDCGEAKHTFPQKSRWFTLAEALTQTTKGHFSKNSHRLAGFSSLRLYSRPFLKSKVATLTCRRGQEASSSDGDISQLLEGIIFS